MAATVRFKAPREVEVVDLPLPSLAPGQVRVRTIASGISAGTELTAYRGTNPYLTSDWDPELRMFHERAGSSTGYPLEGWGYSEVGEVIETAPEDESGSEDDVVPGDIVWGIWGHRAEAVLAQTAVRGHQLLAGVEPAAGCFVRVGAIALNAVLAARAGLGSTVVVVGQGVIGLLATRYAVLSGATVIAVDGVEERRNMAEKFGAHHVFAPSGDLPAQVREVTSSTGVDAAIELSGSYPGLQSAIRLVGPDGVVIASGFYQGEGGMRLGEEFHHNRVQILASQIGSAPNAMHARWDVPRLQRTVVDLLRREEPDVASLITHRYDLNNAAEAYELLDTAGGDALQVVLEMS